MPKEKNSALCAISPAIKAGARQLDHRADLVVDLGAFLLGDRFRHRVDTRLDQVELSLGGDQRHHDFRHHRLAGPFGGL